MIPKECKRLIEADFRIAEVSRHSAREKNIRRGHPSALHLWWARRPLAACRAALLGLLLPDPCDEECPAGFKTTAREVIRPLQGVASDDEDLREALLDFIADFANWDYSDHPAYLGAARALVRAANDEQTPLVLDHFAGGGAIPLEALRLGCDALASDLNPVACLILRAMLEDTPRQGPGLADELRDTGKEVKAEADKEVAAYYPSAPGEGKPVGYFWARTVRCEEPDCGAQIPLVRSFWLRRRGSSNRALRYTIERRKGHAPSLRFEVFEPSSDRLVPKPTVHRATATCPCCEKPLSAKRVRFQLARQRGGADVIFDKKGRRTGGAMLLAVMCRKPGVRQRHYRLPKDADYKGVHEAAKAAERLRKTSLADGTCPLPDEPMDTSDPNTLAGRGYGTTVWGDVFSSRQALVLASLAKLVRARWAASDPAIVRLLALSVSKAAERCSSIVSWIPQTEAPRGTFARQAIPMVWDYLELVPVLDGTDYMRGIEAMAQVIEQLSSAGLSVGQVERADARSPILPDSSVDVYFTDPPYYNAICYAILSDLFYVWLKRCNDPNDPVAGPLRLSGSLTPKKQECIQNLCQLSEDGKPKDKSYYERSMQEAFAAARKTVANDGIGCVVFAHKSTEGWETLLSALTGAGWVITASWPITTERAARLQANQSAALAASIHLVCRPRPGDAGVGDWGQVIRALPRRINEWMDRLSVEGIRGADLVFACIGPGLELFSRYERVETPDGEEVGLGPNPHAGGEPARRGFLSYIWEVVGRTALKQVLGTAEATAYNSAVGALEEDARLTALFLWTLQSAEQKPKKGSDADEEEEASKGRPSFSLIYDIARRFAQPLGIHLEDWEGRIIKTEKGVVRLIPVVDRAGPLFGDEGAAAAGRRFEEAARRDPQRKFAFMEELEKGAVPEIRGPRRRKARAGDVSEDQLRARREATTLDRVHVAMLLQAGGQSNALRAHLETEIARGPNFLRLANALSALYPTGSEEKRLLDAMLLAVPRR